MMPLLWACSTWQGGQESTFQCGRAMELYLHLMQGPLPWESPLALANLLLETPTQGRAEGADVPFTALSPALQKTNERDYLTDISLLSLSITCGFLSKGCRLRKKLCRSLSGICL